MPATPEVKAKLLVQSKKISTLEGRIFSLRSLDFIFPAIAPISGVNVRFRKNVFSRGNPLWRKQKEEAENPISE